MANFVLGTSRWPPLDMDLGSHRDEHYLHSGFRAFISECPNCMERVAFILWKCRSGFGIVTACAQSLEPASKITAPYFLFTISSDQVALWEESICSSSDSLARNRTDYLCDLRGVQWYLRFWKIGKEHRRVCECECSLGRAKSRIGWLQPPESRVITVHSVGSTNRQAMPPCKVTFSYLVEMSIISSSEARTSGKLGLKVIKSLILLF